MTINNPVLFSCLACGYIYDENQEKTTFDQLPDVWQCPICQSNKQNFEQQDLIDSKPTAQNKNIVIVGAGLAGWHMVDALRSLDEQIKITLISADDADRYHKPMLSVAISQGKTKQDLVRMTGQKSAKTANIRLLARTRLLCIDPKNKIAKTDKGDIYYDNLVLAIGAEPIYPPNVMRHIAHDVNHLDAFSQLQKQLNQPKRIAILGGGMVGVELAEDLHNAGHQVSIIDRNALPLNSLFPPIATQRILDAIKDLGIQFYGQSHLKQMHKNDDLSLQILHLPSEQTHTLAVDELIVCTGLGIDESLLTKSQIDFDASCGIRVNSSTLQTNQPNIYALGDCIVIDGFSCRYVMPHRSQAMAIANQILQNTGEYQHKPPMIRLKNKCITVVATGLPRADANWEIVQETPNELSIELKENGQVVSKLNLKTPIK